MSSKIIYSHTGLRGIAAVVVLMTHLTVEQKVSEGLNSPILSIFNWPNQAVDLFFILSGFILNWVYFDAATISWRKYITARCVKILPLYYITLLTFLHPYFATFRIMGWMHENGKIFEVFMANLLLVAGFLGENHNDWVLNVPSWSISIEFFAYLFIFPILVLFQNKYSRETAYMLMILCLTGLLSCYIFKNTYLLGWDWKRFSRGAFGFSVGFLICTLFRNSKSPSSKFIDVILFSFFIVIVLSATKLLPINLITISSPCIVYLCAFDKGIFCNILKLNPFQWLGERSFSIYLWHCPIIYVLFIPNITFIDSYIKLSGANLGWAHLGILVLAVGIVSEVSYSFFEEPIRKFSRRF